jgi:hypothetical protein
MNASVALVGAAAALLGALIGGTATLLAGRIQWRRESRQKAYAELLTASHEVRWWLEGHQPSASTPDQIVEPIRKFFSALDAASVVASYHVQIALNDWTTTAEDLPQLSQAEASMTDEEARRKLVRQWIEQHQQFHASAKHELGIKGEIAFSRRAISYAVISAILLAISALALYPTYPPEEIDGARRSGTLAFGAAFLALLLATYNALRADIASRRQSRHLAFLGFGLGLLVVALVTLINFDKLEPWTHVSVLVTLVLCLAVYGVSRLIAAVRSSPGRSKDKEQSARRQHQEADSNFQEDRG